MNAELLLRPFRPIQRRHVELMRQVARIQHGLLDQSTSLGFLWSFLHPLILLLVLFAFFSRRVGDGIPNYAIYLLIALVQFTHFSKSTASAMRVLHRMRSLATTVIFPKDVLIYSAVLSGLPEFLISLAATLVIAIAVGVEPSWAMLLLPVIVATQILLVIWMSLLLSVMYVFVRDLDHIFEVGMRILFFVTPIIYSLEMLSPATRRIALLNPMAHVIGYARTVILEGRLPVMTHLLGFVTLNLVCFYIAASIFRRAEPAVVEQL